MGFAFDDTGMPVLIPDRSEKPANGNGHAAVQSQWTTLSFDPDQLAVAPIDAKRAPIPADSAAPQPTQAYAGLQPMGQPPPDESGSKLRPFVAPTPVASPQNGTNQPEQKQASLPPPRNGAPTPTGFPSPARPANGNRPTPVDNEQEIGELLVQAERFAEEALADAEQRAQAIVDAATQHANSIVERAVRQAAEASSEAAAEHSTIEKYERQARQHGQKIVDSAQAHAHSIVDQARKQAEEITRLQTLPFPNETITHLCTAIEEFAEMNRMLVAELTSLRTAFSGWLENGSAPIPIHPMPAVFEAALQR